MRAVHSMPTGRATLRRPWDSPLFDVVVSMLASFLLLVPTGLLAMPATVDRLTVENPTAYDISVAVSGANDDGWMSVLIVEHDGTAWTTNVIDQGDTWRFRFRGQGRAGGELTINRSDLVTADWTVTIPTEVGDRLAELGAPPSS